MRSTPFIKANEDWIKPEREIADVGGQQSLPTEI
jgi:hypothetical protein